MSSNLAESFGTLSETTNGLKQAGYTLDFNLHAECIVCHHTNTTFSPEEFRIDKAYRFEGDSNPDDESIVYAISSRNFGVKGVLVNGYGPSDDAATSRLIERLRTSDAAGVVDAIASGTAPQTSSEIAASPMMQADLHKIITQLKAAPAWRAGNPSSVAVYKSGAMRIMLMGLSFHFGIGYTRTSYPYRR